MVTYMRDHGPEILTSFPVSVIGSAKNRVQYTPLTYKGSMSYPFLWVRRSRQVGRIFLGRIRESRLT